MKFWILCVAQGGFIGRIPVAPGTWGSVVGLAWVAVLLSLPNPALALAGMVGAIAIAVWFCGAAEKILNQTDPGSVVLDEIVALPVCYVGWVWVAYSHHGVWPAARLMVGREGWPMTILIFLAFRFFDVLKPWPVRQSQALPGGWGVVVDDVLAACYVNVVALAFCLLRS